MASIDKIYATPQQYAEWKSWCSRNRKSLLHKSFDWAYRIRTGWPEDREFPLVCLSEKDDRWLVRHCPLPWVQERLREMYPKGYWDDIVFIPRNR